jgi:CRP-like cAMP-binding protein
MSDSQRTNFNKGEIIFSQGDESSHLYIIKKGIVRIVKEVQGRLVPVTFLKEKDFLGELTVFSDQTRSVTAIAASETELVFIQRSEIQTVLSSLPVWMNDLMHTLSDRLSSLEIIKAEHKITDENLVNENSFNQGEELIIQTKIKSHRSS